MSKIEEMDKIFSNKELSQEYWRDIPQWEGFYQASTLGRIRSIDRWVDQNGMKPRFYRGLILSAVSDKDGYLRVSLHKSGYSQMFTIHRLVALSFISNPNNYSEINHKDEIKTNNRVDNLEWCTVEYNLLYSNSIEKACSARKRKVEQRRRDGTLLRAFDSMSDASRETGVNINRISGCANKKKGFKYAGGYSWSLK